MTMNDSSSWAHLSTTDISEVYSYGTFNTHMWMTWGIGMETEMVEYIENNEKNNIMTNNKETQLNINTDKLTIGSEDDMDDIDHNGIIDNYHTEISTDKLTIGS